MKNYTEKLKVIIDVMEEQNQIYNYQMSPEEIRSLTYAFNCIDPHDHQELAFVMFCGFGSEKELIVDEYCRRKKGEKPLIKDHSLLNLDGLAFPDTQRIFIYREQLDALLDNLSGYKGVLLRKRIQKRLVTVENFADELTDEFKKNISDNDLKDLTEIIFFYVSCCIPYYLCSTLANRVENILNKKN